MSSFYAQGQVAINGIADLSHYSIEDNAPFDLSGTWEFYWNKLLAPGDFNQDREPEWIEVPVSWHKQHDHPVLGFATYRLRLVLPAQQRDLSLYFPIINSSAKIWVNGVLAGETGKVSKDPDQYEPRLLGTIVSIPDHVTDVEVILQAANYTYFRGGIGGIPKLGKSAVIFSDLSRDNGIENLFEGCLMAMCIYQLILYFLYQRGKPFLWLALICLGVALRGLITNRGSFLLPNLFPFMSWESWKKIEFSCIYGIIAFFPLYIYHLFPLHAPKKPVMFFVVIASTLCLAVIVTPQYIYGKLLEICHASLIAAFIYAFCSVVFAWRAGKKDARIIFFGVIASFPFIMAEILKNNSIYPIHIHFMYLVEIGVLVFLIFQVYLLAYHYADSYKSMATVNLNLERMVEERTGQLRTANAVKDKLLSILSHDIKSPLYALQGMLQVYNKGSITEGEFKQYASMIESDLNKTSILMENILYWTASQLKGVQLKMERFKLYQLVEDNIQLFQTVAANKKITLSHNTPAALVINSDRNILHLVLRNLLSNAIKFSFEGGAVAIHVDVTDKMLLIQVKDQGIGMDEDTIQTLVAPDIMVSTSGTRNEKGTGMGLALCREYLQKAGGHLSIDSVKGSGTTFNMIFPLD